MDREGEGPLSSGVASVGLSDTSFPLHDGGVGFTEEHDACLESDTQPHWTTGRRCPSQPSTSSRFRGGGSQTGRTTGKRPANVSAAQAARIRTIICEASDRSDIFELLGSVTKYQGELTWANLILLLQNVAKLAKARGIVEAIGCNSHLALLRDLISVELEHQEMKLKRTEGTDKSSLVGGTDTNNNSSALHRGWSTIAWSYATLQVHDMPSFGRIAYLATSSVRGFRPVELSNLLWAFAKVNFPAPSLFYTAGRSVIVQLHRYSVGGLSTLAWAFVTMQPHPPAALLKRLSEVFVGQVDKAESREIANMCWALASAKVVRPHIFKQLGDAIVTKIATFNSQELSTSAWAFSRARVRHVGFFEAVEQLFASDKEAAARIHDQGLANLLWALVRQLSLGLSLYTVANIMHELLPPCCEVLDRLKPQEFSSVLWSVAKLGITYGLHPQTDRLFELAATLQPMRDRLLRLSAQGLTNVLYAFVEFLKNGPMLVHIGFLSVLTSVIRDRLEEFEPKGIAYVLQSLNRMERWQSPLIDWFSFNQLREALPKEGGSS